MRQVMWESLCFLAMVAGAVLAVVAAHYVLTVNP